MSRAQTIIRQSDEGERLWFAGGGLFTMKATSAETGGAFLMLEDRMEHGKVTPLHVHANEDEALYVLQGDLLLHVDGEEHELHEGGFFLAPRGVPHAFMVTSETAHVIAIQTPGSGEAFYRAASDPASTPGEAPRPADFDRLRAVAQNSPSIDILGPPPFALPGQEAISSPS